MARTQLTITLTANTQAAASVIRRAAHECAVAVAHGTRRPYSSLRDSHSGTNLYDPQRESTRTFFAHRLPKATA